MRFKAYVRMLPKLSLLILLGATLSIANEQWLVLARASYTTKIRHFRLLAVERQYDSCNMKSAQHLIKELLKYQNWNNGTTTYVSHIHLLSMYSYEEVDDECKAYLRGKPTKANLQREIVDFLGQAIPGDIVIVYYVGHGYWQALILDRMVFARELVSWLLSGGLPRAYVNVILDTCASGSWIYGDEGGVLGPGRIVLASCGHFGTSWGWCHSWSWFTFKGVIEGFVNAIDSNNDGWISAAEDFTYAKPATELYAAEYGLTQNPTSYYGLFNGNVPLVQRDVTKPFPRISATIDADPDTMKLKSKGKWITIYIELPQGYDLNDITFSTIKLNNIVKPDPHPIEIGDYDEDGILDLMVKFDRSSVTDLLDIGETTLLITGEVSGKPFDGTDTIRVIDE